MKQKIQVLLPLLVLIVMALSCNNSSRIAAAAVGKTDPAATTTAVECSDHYDYFQACFKCGGSGRLHRSNMPHSAGCIFCHDCSGCGGTGSISNNVSKCPKCEGHGRYHRSSMPHSNDCIFCSNCETCNAKGHVKND